LKVQDVRTAPFFLSTERKEEGKGKMIGEGENRGFRIPTAGTKKKPPQKRWEPVADCDGKFSRPKKRERIGTRMREIDDRRLLRGKTVD